MVFLLLSLYLQGIVAHEIRTLWYELESTISLDCKDTGQWTGVSEVSCAIAAVADNVYNFGFVVTEEACMVCRAGGTLAEVGVHEVIINGTLHVHSKEYYIYSYIHTDLNINFEKISP